MIGALFGGFFEIAKKPAILLPPAMTLAVVLALTALAEPAISGFLFSVVLGDVFPQAGLLQFPFLLYTMYANEINLIFVLAFVFGIAGNWLAFCFAHYLKEREGVLESMGFAAKNLANAFYLAIFSGIVFTFLFFVLWIIMVVAEAIGLLGIVLLIVFAVLALLAFLVLLFLPTAMAVDETGIKDALKKSSEFVRKRVIAAIVFLLIVGLVYSLLANIGSNAADGTQDDLLAFTIEFAFLLLATAFAGIAVPSYYLSGQK